MTRVISEEQKKKTSLSMMGHTVSKETREKLRLANLGKKSPLKGVPRPLEVIAKISTSKMGHIVSEESKLRMSLAKKVIVYEPVNCRGNKHWKWRGGITPVEKKVRNSVDYKQWRSDVVERDDWTCQACWKRGGNLEVHHIKSFTEYPELRLELDNGTTLCKECHSLTKEGRPIVYR